MRALFAASHPGGMNAILPVYKRLEADKELLAYTHTSGIAENAGITHVVPKDVGVDYVKRMLDIFSPDIIVTGRADRPNGDVLEHSLILASEGIPTVTVSDFWTNNKACFIFDDFSALPTVITAIDNLHKEIMTGEGIPPGLVEVTGNPYFDSLEQLVTGFTQIRRDYIRSRYGGDFLAFYAGDRFKRERESVGFWDLDNVRLIERKLSPDQRLVVSLHPRMPAEERDEIRSYVSSSKYASLEEEIPSRELALASDVVFTAVSTVGVEALMMGRPAVSLQPGLMGRDYISFVTGPDIMHVGYTKVACECLINHALRDDDFRNGIVRIAMDFRLQPDATGRVIDLIGSLS